MEDVLDMVLRALGATVAPMVLMAALGLVALFMISLLERCHQMEGEEVPAPSSWTLALRVRIHKASGRFHPSVLIATGRG